ncbi:lethal(3)malignant brain tumor-like protein 3 [Littorina saxatilis]
MMNASHAESLLVKTCPVTTTVTVSPAQVASSDVNENATKSPRLLAPTAVSEGTVPVVASPASMVTSMPFSQVSSPTNVMAFPTGINLTISNGTLPVMSTPGSSAVMTPTASLLGNTQVTQTHTALKVPNPTTIQLRPQVYSTLQNSNIAMAMHNRLQLPFQTTVGQSFSVPTSINTLRSISSSSVLSQQVQFQAMAPLRGTPVTIATGSQPGLQPSQPQQMSIRSAAAFPVLINRPIAFNPVSSRPQLITAQPTRLAPRQMSTQVALQMAGQQPVPGATIMPLFRPANTAKAVGLAAAPGGSNAGITSQAQQAQFVNQVMATTNMQGMTHISLRPTAPNTRPQKIPDARLLTGVPVNRLLRPGPITITTLSSSGTMGLTTEPVVSISQGFPICSSAGSFLQPKTDINAITPEKKPPESTAVLVGEPQVKLAVTSLPITTISQENAVMSIQGTASTLIPRLPVGKDIAPKTAAQEVEAQRGEAMDTTAPATTSEVDAMKVMDWADGIASLPGSNLKFKVNEFGLMEMVTEEQTPPVKTVVDSAVGVNTTDFTITASLTSDGISDLQAEMPNKEKEPLRKCENCGKYGYLRDFCKTGRFCSQACVGAFAGRKNKQSPQSLLSSKMLVNLKKKHKKSVGEENQITIITPPATESEVMPERDRPFSAPSKKGKGFDWQAYLDEQKAVGAPARLFKDPFPSQKNAFKAGMRLEGVDPKHQNLFCVLSVAETQGYRLRLHFDGYSECYDFWCNADSPFIFPIGWCEKNNRPLQPPKQIPQNSFNWATYLRTTKSIAAPKTLFANQPATNVTPSAFRVGMKLEAVDRKNTALICVATVTDVLGDKVLVHFDSWEDVYDYWCDITSPYIHPVGWCQENARALSPPCSWTEVETFTWEDYLTQTKSQGVPARAFKPRPPLGLEPGMKVEAVDRRNPIMVRVATIQEVKEHQVLIHFDGWPEMYDYWLDDDASDIKPPGWCQRTGHVVQPPYVEATHVQGSCPTPGCNGVGHIKGAKYVGHHSAFGCPYSSLNMNKDSTLQDRLGSTRAEEGSAAPLAARVKMESGEIRKCPTPGCDSSGHVTGRFTSHHRLSGCPLYEKNVLRMNAELAAKSAVRPGRGRKRKHFHFSESDAKGENGLRIKRERLESSLSFVENVHQSVFMSTVPATPSQEGPPFWEYHAKLLPGVSEVRGDEVRSWGVDQVARFVGSLPNCQEHEKTFREQEIDGDSFLLLTQADIVKIMNVKLGPALKIFNSIFLFQQTSES